MPKEKLGNLDLSIRNVLFAHEATCLWTGFLGIFGKKEKPKPTATTTMLYTLNRDMIAWQQTIISGH